MIDKLNNKSITAKEMWDTCKKDVSKKYLFEIARDHNLENNILVPACCTPGEIGVFCSMRRIWKDVAINNHNRALILEDDSKTSNRLSKTNSFNNGSSAFGVGYNIFTSLQ